MPLVIRATPGRSWSRSLKRSTILCPIKPDTPVMNTVLFFALAELLEL